MSNAILSFAKLIGEQFYHFINFIKLFQSTFIETGIGAFVGAWAAFQLNKYETKKEKLNRENTALINTQFILMAELNQACDLEKYCTPLKEKINEQYEKNAKPKKDVLQKIKIDHPTCFALDMITKINGNKLLFLLNKKTESRDLIAHIFETETEFNQVIKKIEYRNKYKLIVDEIIGKIPNEERNMVNIIDKCGEDKIGYLVSGTGEICKSVPNCIKSLCTSIDLLTAFIDAYYPDKALIIKLTAEYKRYLSKDHPILTKVIWMEPSKTPCIYNDRNE